jgi:hypothetical protein
MEENALILTTSKGLRIENKENLVSTGWHLQGFRGERFCLGGALLHFERRQETEA